MTPFNHFPTAINASPLHETNHSIMDIDLKIYHCKFYDKDIVVKHISSSSLDKKTTRHSG